MVVTQPAAAVTVVEGVHAGEGDVAGGPGNEHSEFAGLGNSTSPNGDDIYRKIMENGIPSFYRNMSAPALASFLASLFGNIKNQNVLAKKKTIENHDDYSEYLCYLSPSSNIESVRLLSESVGDPYDFLLIMINFIRQKELKLSVMCIEGLIDFYYPFIECAKTSESVYGSKSQFATQEFLVALMKQYPQEEPYFQAFSYRTFTDFLVLMRHAKGDFLANNFRCFAELYAEIGSKMSSENFERLQIDFLLTFTPNHPFFVQSYLLVERAAVHNFDSSKFLKLLIRLKIGVNLLTFELIDFVLSSKKKNVQFVIEYLFQVAVSKPVWSITASYLLTKHMNYISSDAQTKKWCINFIRRSFQWMQITHKIDKHESKRPVIAHAMSEIAKKAPAEIAYEINLCSSTLIMSKFLPELSYYFEPGSFDQSFLDEIDVIEPNDDLLEQLCSPVTVLRPDQIRRIEAKRNQSKLPLLKDSEIVKSQNDLEKTILKSLNFFYAMLALIMTIVVLVIFS